MKPLDRRTLLRGMGGLAFSLPMLNAMVPSRAAAAAAKPPRRIIFIHTPNGFLLPQWRVSISGTSSRTYAPSPILAQLGDLTKQSIFIDGMATKSGWDSHTCAAGHPAGTSSQFTGSYAGSGTMYGGNAKCTLGAPVLESIDQAIARQTKGATRIPSLTLGAMSQGSQVSTRVFYAGGQTFVEPQGDPAQVYAALFSDFQTPGNQAALQKQLEERRYLLGGASDEFKKLRCKLESSDRERLDRHQQAILDLSTSLGFTSTGLACSKPSAPAGIDLKNFANLPAVVNTQFDLMTMAFACDLTRVVSMQIHAPDGQPGTYSWLSNSQYTYANSWHTISHLVNDARIAEINKWYAKQIVLLTQKLKAVKEADGSTLFDNTVIVWTSEIGESWSHNLNEIPWHVIGSGQGYFDVGQYVQLDKSNNARHNRLLVHFLNYMGIPATGFGHPDWQGSALPGIKA